MKTHQLQGIRGLAALVVAIGHCLGVFATPPWFAHLKNISNGHAAVVMFFVLSGFVLTLSLRSRREPPAAFYVKRIFRIYPAWVVACAASLAYLALIHYRFPIEGGSDWWRDRFRGDRFHLLFIAASFGGALAFLLPQGWTIFVELVASALMPIIAWTSRRNRRLFHALMGVALIVSLAVGERTYYGVGSYLIDFFLGAWLASTPRAVLAMIAATERRATVGLLGAVAVLLTYRNLAPNAAYLEKLGYNNGLTQGVEALCCVWILGVVIYGGGPLRWLNSRAITHLGEISYSFYLIHLPIACVLATLVAVAPIGPIAKSLTLLTVTLPLSIVAAGIMYRLIERPGVALGGGLSKRLVGRVSSAGTPQ